jgi:hypothetical protein
MLSERHSFDEPAKERASGAISKPAKERASGAISRLRVLKLVGVVVVLEGIFAGSFPGVAEARRRHHHRGGGEAVPLAPACGPATCSSGYCNVNGVYWLCTKIQMMPLDVVVLRCSTSNN